MTANNDEVVEGGYSKNNDKAMRNSVMSIKTGR